MYTLYVREEFDCNVRWGKYTDKSRFIFNDRPNVKGEDIKSIRLRQQMYSSWFVSSKYDMKKTTENILWKKVIFKNIERQTLVKYCTLLSNQMATGYETAAILHSKL